MKLSSITPERLINSIKMLVLIPGARWYRHFTGNIWIITERPNQARDNGYVFFRYLREKHPEDRAYYIIDKKASDYKKIESFGNVIQFNSWRHFFYFCLAPVHISAHVGGCNPNNTPIVRRFKKQIGYHDVFLPHGVSYGVSEFCLQKYAKIDLFVTSGKPEYDNVLENYGYSNDEVVYTGFPRLDNWHNLKVNNKLILLMPTWRLYLAQNPETIFESTAYYKAFEELISSKEVDEFLVANHIRLVFYLHYNMLKYADYFHTDCHNIEIVKQDEKYDIQELIKSAALLITDYSSVHFDFAYMGKPVLYYQFDREEFWQKQYQQSEFDASKDGFGPVAYDLDQLLENLQSVYKSGFLLQGEYEKRMKQFYLYRDNHNCDRVYEKICAKWSVGKLK